MIIYSGQFTAFINGKSTNVDFNGKFNYKKDTIRITLKHYQKKFQEAAKAAIANNSLTQENYESGYFDMYFEDTDHNQYKYSYKQGGFSNNLDNGYFLRKQYVD